MSLCAICGKLLSSSESGRRPCCQARVHSKCIQGYAEYCHNSGNSRPSCPVCKLQTEDLQSKSGQGVSLLNVLRKSSNSSSSGEGSTNNRNANGSIALSSPKSPRMAEAEALIQKAEKRSAEKERQVLDAERQIAEEQARLRKTAAIRPERSKSPASESQTIASFQKTISVLEDRISNMAAEANQKQSEFDKRIRHEISLRKELEQNFNSLADFSTQLQNQEKELSTLLEVEQNEHAACKSSLSTAESQVSLLTTQLEHLQQQNDANESLLSSAQGLSKQTEEYYNQQIEDLSYNLSSTSESLKQANDELSRALEAQKYYEDKCSELEFSNKEFQQRISELDRSQDFLKLNDEFLSLKDEYLDLQGQLAEARQEVMVLRDSNQESVSELEHLRLTNKHLEGQNLELTEKVSDIQSLLDKAQASSQQLEGQIAILNREKGRMQHMEQSLRNFDDQYQAKCREVEEIEAQMSNVCELKDSKINHIQSQLESLQEAQQSTQKQYEDSLSAQKDLYNELQSVQETRARLESMLESSESIREDNERLVFELDALRSSYEEVQGQNSQLLSNQASSQSEIAEILEREQILKVQLSSLKEELEVSEKRIELAATKDRDIEQRLSELIASLQESEENYRSAVLANADLEQRLDESESQRKVAEEVLQSEAAELRAQLLIANDEIESLSRSNEEYRHRLSDLQNLEKTKSDLEQELHDLRESLRDSEEQIITLSDELSNLRILRDSDASQHENSLEQLQAELTELRSLQDATESDNGLLKVTIDGLRSDLEIAREVVKKESENSELLNSRLAERIEELQEELARSVEQSQAELDRLQTSLDESLDKLKASLQKASASEARLNEAKDEVSNLDAALKDACLRLNEFEMMASERSSECDQLKEQLSELAIKFSDLMSENDKRSRDNARLLHMFEQSEEDRRSLKEQLLHEHKRHKQVSELFTRSLNAHKNEFRSLQDELTDVKLLLAKSLEERSHFAVQARSIEDLMPIVESQRSEMNKLQNDYSRVCALLEAMEDTESDRSQQMDAIVEQLKNKDIELEGLRAESSSLRLNIAEIRDQAEKYRMENTTLNLKIKETESRLLELSQLKAPLEINVSNKPSRDASPALSRASTTATSNIEPLFNGEPALSRASTSALSRELSLERSTSDGVAAINPVINITPAIDEELSNGVGKERVTNSHSSSRALSPALSRHSSATPSPTFRAAPDPLTVHTEPAPPAGRPSGPMPPIRAPLRPVPLRRMAPPVRRPSPPTNPERAAPSDDPPSDSISSVNVSHHQEAVNSSDANGDVEKSTSRTQSPVNVIDVPTSAPVRPPVRPVPLRGPPGRPLPFRPQPIRRGPPGPSRLPLPNGTAPSPSNPVQNHSVPSPSSSTPSRSSSPPSPRQNTTVLSPRLMAIDQESNSSNIDVPDTDKESNEVANLRSDSSDRPNSPITVRPNSATSNGPAPRLAPPTRPVPASIRRAPSGPFRPGRLGPPMAAARPLPAPTATPPPKSAVDNSATLLMGEDIDVKPAEANLQPPSKTGPVAPSRPLPGGSGLVARRPIPPPGRRVLNAPPPSRSTTVPPSVGRSSVSMSPPPASSALPVGSESPNPNRSRSSSPKPTLPAQNGLLDLDQNVRDEPSSSFEHPLRSQSTQSHSRNVPAKSPPRSKSLLKKLLSSDPLDNHVEKVDFVFDRRSGSWVPEGTAEPDSDNISGVFNTVHRLRTQVHQTRQEISNANAQIPESRHLASAHSVVSDEKWVEACELLRESTVRLPAGDPLRARIDKFLNDAGSGSGPLPDAVSELEDLLQTVQTQNEKSSRSGRFVSVFMLFSVLVAVAAVIFHQFYPEQANQAFEVLRACALRVVAWIQSAQSAAQSAYNEVIDEYDDSDRVEL